MILRLGMESPDVVNLERVLLGMGFQGFEADGVFDAKTQNVVKYIQQSHGLNADGIVGDQTFALLDRLYQPQITNFGSTYVENTVAVKTDSNLPVILQKVHPRLAEKAMQILDLANTEGYQLRITQGLRTFAEQDKLYAQGRTRPGNRVTNARGGFSYHNYGIAVDFAFVVKGEISWDERLYKNIGRWAGRVGLEWGGGWRFTDLPHCQLFGMTSIRALLNCYNANGGNEKGIQAVWRQFVR